MTDDFVKRLRDVPHDFSLNSELRCIAADRIEKLTDELHHCFHRIEELQAALREAMNDTPGWYDLARKALEGKDGKAAD